MPRPELFHDFIVLADTPRRAKRVMLAALRSIETQSRAPHDDNLDAFIKVTQRELPQTDAEAKKQLEDIFGPLTSGDTGDLPSGADIGQLDDNDTETGEHTNPQAEAEGKAPTDTSPEPNTNHAPDDQYAEQGPFGFEVTLLGELAQSYLRQRRSLGAVARPWFLPQPNEIKVRCRFYCLSITEYRTHQVEQALSALAANQGNAKEKPNAADQVPGEENIWDKAVVPVEVKTNRKTIAWRRRKHPISLLAVDCFNLKPTNPHVSTVYGDCVNKLKELTDKLLEQDRIFSPISVIALDGGLVLNAILPTQRSILNADFIHWSGFPTIACYQDSYLENILAYWQIRRPEWQNMLSPSAETTRLVIHDTNGFDLETMSCSFAVLSPRPEDAESSAHEELIVPLLLQGGFATREEQSANTPNWSRIEPRWSTFRGALPLVAAFIGSDEQSTALVTRFKIESPNQGQAVPRKSDV